MPQNPPNEISVSDSPLRKDGYASGLCSRLADRLLTLTSLWKLPSTTDSETEHAPIKQNGSRQILKIHNTHRVGWLRVLLRLARNRWHCFNGKPCIRRGSSRDKFKGYSNRGHCRSKPGRAAMSMAAGEHVSASSQADAERADLNREQKGTREPAPSRSTKELTGHLR